MSQVVFDCKHNGKRASVMAGWDHPLKHYFLTVLDLDAPEDESDVVWTTLFHPSEQDSLHTQHLQKQLREMAIEAPEGFWDHVHLRERNVVYLYEDGKWTRH